MGTLNAVPSTIPGVRKAAILLLSLGDEASAELIRQLSEEEIHRVTMEVTQLGSVGPRESEKVLDEFYHSTTFIGSGQGGSDRARRMLEQALGPDVARRVLDGITRTLKTGSDGIRALQEADPRQVANFIHNEHPQTIALILSNMKTAQAGAVLMSLPPEIRPAVARRIAKLDEVSPEVLNRIANVMDANLRSLGKTQSKTSSGPRAVADLLNQIDPTASGEIVRDIAKTDPELGESIRDLMFVFEDVLNIDKEGIKAVLAAIDRKVLTIALKGASDNLKAHFMQSMSQRAGEMLREDLEALGPVRLREVDAARKEIVTKIKKLQEEGAISAKGGGGGDEYVL